MAEVKYQKTPVNDPPVYSENTVENKNEPEDNSLNGQLRKAKHDSANLVEYVQKLAKILFDSIVTSICAIGLLLIPIAMIVIGVLYKNECNVQKYIPIWLIVTGACTSSIQLLKAVVNITNFIVIRKEDLSRNAIGILEYIFESLIWIIGVFMIVWFIFGSLWVYGNYTNVEYNKNNGTNATNYCHVICYLSSFWSLTALWPFVALLCCIFCAGICQ